MQDKQRNHELIEMGFKIVARILKSVQHIDNIWRKGMKNQPNWLDIQDQLYPELYVTKIFHVQSSSVGAPIQYHSQVVYNSLHRQINVTQAISELILQFFDQQASYEILMFDSEDQKFKCVGFYPFKEPILLKGVFVQNELLAIRLENIIQPITQSKNKNKTDKSLKIILQKVAQWRKIHLDSGKKVTLQEAAGVVGIARNTLDDYYCLIKLAEKYGFDFQGQLEEPFGNLRKFVKANEDKKAKSKNSNPLPNILSKYQPK